MACTTLLVGKNASYDGSTMIARNDDSGSGHFTAKKFVVVQPEEHPAVYRSVLSHVEIPLPGDPMRMTAMPNAVEGKGPLLQNKPPAITAPFLKPCFSYHITDTLLRPDTDKAALSFKIFSQDHLSVIS